MKTKIKSVRKKKSGGVNLLTAIKNSETTLTLNGALTHKSTNSAVLDLFAMGAAMRSRAEADIISLFSNAFAEDPLLALKTLFYIRDVRGGQGERRTFRILLRNLATSHAEVVRKNLNIIAEFGRYDDYLDLLGTPLEADVLSLIKTQLLVDSKQLKANKPVSLLGKWLPSINTSSKESVRQAHVIRKGLKLTPKSYRQILSKLRAQIGIVEKAMCSGDWKGINYESVPSRAALIYRNAFKKHDELGYNAFLSKVESGEATIKASTLYPYDLVSRVRKGQSDRTIEAQWKALPDYTKGNPVNTLAVIDTSGSMTWTQVGNVQPLDIAIGLGVYFAERIDGMFKNHVITFSDKPELINFTSDTLAGRINKVAHMMVSGGTNLQAVFDLILNAAVKAKLKAKEMPERIIIFSDMEFNACVDTTYSGPKTNFEVVKDKYKAAKYKVPQMVFWNVNAKTTQAVVKEDEKGVVLLSGASPSVLKFVFTGKMTTPYEAMLEVLNSDRYKAVTV